VERISDIPSMYELIEVNALAGQYKFPEYRFIRKYVSKDIYDSWFRSGHPQIGDVLFATVGTIAEVAILKENRGCIAQNLVALRAEQKLVFPDFLYYSLVNPTTKQALVSLDISSVQPSIKVPHLLEIDFLLPPLPEQRTIAGVLSSLDDKIDLLHQQNKTLEGMAEALWRKMFVEEADLGWKTGKLGDLIELCYGKGLKEENRIAGKYPVLGSSGIVGYHSESLVKGPGIVIGRKGTLGLVNYVEQDFFPIDTTYFIKSKTNSGKLFFEYFLLKEFSFEEMDSDSAVPGLNREIAQSMEFVIPDIGVILEFNGWCQLLFAKMTENQGQIRTLSRLRDTLLPKLMSGEMGVGVKA